MSVILSPLLRARDMLAACKPVQRWLGINVSDASAATQAASRIYLDGISSGLSNGPLTAEEQNNLRPYILVIMSSEGGQSFKKIGAANCYATEGEILIVLSKACPEGASINDLFSLSASEVGAIIANDVSNEPGLLEMSGTASYLNIDELSVYFQGRTPPEEIVNYGDAYDVMLVLRYR